MSELLSGIGKLVELNSSGNPMSVLLSILQIGFLVFLWKWALPHLRGNNKNSDDLNKVLNRVVTLLESSTKEHQRMISLTETISRRYASVNSLDTSISILTECLEGTKHALIHYVHKTIVENDIDNRWDYIQTKIKSKVASAYKDDQSKMRKYRVNIDDNVIVRLSSYFDGTLETKYTEYSLMAVKKKLSSNEIEEGFDNICKNAISDFLRKVKRDEVQQ